MGDVVFHSESSAKRFGGLAEDYEPIHSFLDSSKLHMGDWRHRALLHTTFGLAVCERIFGEIFKRKSDGQNVATRTVATQHIIEDLGCLPTAETFLREMPLRSWMMNGPNARERRKMRSFSIASETITPPATDHLQKPPP
jgi:hypothetical protein